MTKSELFNKIWNLPLFPYRYEGGQEQKDYYALLGYSGSNQPVTFSPPSEIMEILDCMIEVYAKIDLSENDKAYLAKNMHRIQNLCRYRFEGIRSRAEQEKFIIELSDDNFIAVCKQVEMYGFARKLYGEGYR